MTRLQLLCTGTPAPLAHRGGSSYLVQTGDEILVFDCGPGSVRRMLEAGLALPSIDHLFLTHLHYGHLDAATTARDAGVKTLVLVHLTEQLETPGVRERVLHEVGEVFDGQVILGQDLLEVPLGTIDAEPVR